MKTILQINSVINSGSTGRIAEEIGKIAIDNGWKSYIAYARNEKNSQSQKIKIGNNVTIYWHVLQTRLFDKHGLASRTVTKRLIEQIKIIKPGIIHLHNIHGYYINYKLLFEYLSKTDIPVIWTLHDCWAFTGHCPYFSYIHCEKWKDICFACSQKNTYPASYLLDRSRKNFLDKRNSFLSISKNLTLVPVSDWLAKLCSQSFFKDIPVKVIHNGIDINIFKPASEEERIACLRKYGINTNFLILGVASVWTKRKGLDDFIHLASLLPDDYHILLVGLSEKQIAMLPKNITGIKRTENIDALSLLYSCADVFVNPTWEDSFPTTNLEALACGTPIITYNTGGSVESISPETGFVVEQGDIKGLYNTLVTIGKKGKDFYLDNCRKRAVTFYDKQDRYKDYLDIYNKLLPCKEVL